MLKLPILAICAGATASRLENRPGLLLVKPAQKFLEPRIGLDFFHGIIEVSQFIVRPGLVDEILATLASWHNLPTALAPRHDVVAARGDAPQTKDAGLIHKESLNSSKSHAWQIKCDTVLEFINYENCLLEAYFIQVWKPPVIATYRPEPW
jgi:hypothetical protein